MAKLRDLEQYIDYEFSSGCFTGKDYLEFQTKYINYLRSLCKANGWELVNIGRNHYEFTCFIKNGKKYIYFSIGDVRFRSNDWYNHILYRTALHERDYTGGQNHYTNILYLKERFTEMFDKEFYWVA